MLGLRTSAERFRYLYSVEALQEIGRVVRDIASVASEVHVLLNNNWENYAVRGAVDMMAVLDLGLVSGVAETEQVEWFDGEG